MLDNENAGPNHGSSDPHHAPGEGDGGHGKLSIFRSAAAITLGGCAILVITTSPSWGPAMTAECQYQAANALVKSAEQQPVPLGFEQTWERPQSNFLLGYQHVHALAPTSWSGSAGCLIREALGNAAPDKDEAEKRFTDITKDPACPNTGHAFFQIANIQLRRATLQGGVSEFRQAAQSYRIAIPKLKEQPDDQPLYWIAVINLGAIVLQYTEARQSPNDLDTAVVELDYVQSILAKTDGQSQLKQVAALVRSRLTGAKVTALEQALAAANARSAERQKALAAAKTKLAEVQRTEVAWRNRERWRRRHAHAHQYLYSGGARRHQGEQRLRSSWHRCDYARNSSGKTFRVDKCK